MRLAHLRCRLLQGHLPVTKCGGGRVYHACYLCGAQLGPGWDVRDIKPPRVTFAKRIVKWLRRAA